MLPQWLSWMRCPTRDQEVAGSTPAEEVSLFVCVEVLRPNQPNGVMLSAVSLPNHMFTGQA